jgi:hypothetical protein
VNISSKVSLSVYCPLEQVLYDYQIPTMAVSEMDSVCGLQGASPLRKEYNVVLTFSIPE